MFVADAAGSADQRAGVLASALRGLVSSVTLRGHWPGRVGDVARGVVGVALGPVGSVDGGDSPRRVEIEPAQPGEHVIDRGDGAVRTVGVVPALEQPRLPRGSRPTCGHGLR